MPPIAADCRRLPPIATDCHRLPPIATDCHRLPPIAADCRRLPPTAADCRRLPPIAADCRRLPQAFARLAAVHGGTYMLNHAMDESGPVFGEGKFEVQYTDKVATGVKVMDTTANAAIVVGDPSYFPELVKKTGTVVRAIAVVNEPIASTNQAGSYQVIFPGSTVGRTNDLYLFCCSSPHKVTPDGKYTVFCSTTVEGPSEGMSTEALAQRELAAGLSLISAANPARIFYDQYDLMAPLENGQASHVFVSESFDATTHFETAITDVLAMYERIMGEKLILTDGPGSSE